jgi:hypothetical protein
MASPLNKIIHFIAAGLICFTPAYISLSFEEQNKSIPAFHKSDVDHPTDIKGYRDIIFYDGKFLAVGTDGRIDYINNSGERTPVINTCTNNLNCIISEDQILVVAGDNGTILFSSDGQVFTKVESGTDKNINGITFKNDLLIAGADKGTILISNNGKTWSGIHLEVKGNIVSVMANDSFCIGITDSGEIIRTYDGFNWEITDYNKKYSGYYKSCIFKKTLLTKNRIVIIGSHDDGSPAVLFSSLGNVWTERSLNYDDDHGMICILTNIPNDITYDPARDQFFLACDNGKIFSLPSCTKCNKSVTVTTNDLHAIICTDDLLLSAGEDFYVNILKL